MLPLDNFSKVHESKACWNRRTIAFENLKRLFILTIIPQATPCWTNLDTNSNTTCSPHLIIHVVNNENRYLAEIGESFIVYFATGIMLIPCRHLDCYAQEGISVAIIHSWHNIALWFYISVGCIQKSPLHKRELFAKVFCHNTFSCT